LLQVKLKNLICISANCQDLMVLRDLK